MARLGKTIAQLSKIKAHSLADAFPGFGAHGVNDALSDLPDFGSNPGALKARFYVPEKLVPRAPLVVVLHGCTQNAAGYNHGSGWSQLAQEHGFALLFPEQQRANNPNLCFNWFSPADIRRDGGEALSIRQMVAAMVARHDIDRARIYVTGLSAGGAMTSVMLATWPEVFAGGAIIAGLPFGAAQSVPDALARMRGQGYPSDAKLTALVRDASGHQGRWPLVSVWHGSADTTVDRSNADRIVAQWRGVHAIGSATPSFRDIVDGCEREFWLDSAGRPIIESYMVPGMGHGTPLKTRGADSCGTSGPYMLDVGISSTRHIARSWGLLNTAADGTAADQVQEGDVAHPTISPVSARAPDRALVGKRPIRLFPVETDHVADRPATRVGAIIEDALRAAGLMR